MEYPHNRPYTADDLVRIITLLRDPVNGCPWDKVQTHTSIRMNFLEEAYEAVDALDLDDPDVLGALGMAGMWEAVFGDVGVTIIAVLNAMRILKK